MWWSLLAPRSCLTSFVVVVAAAAVRLLPVGVGATDHFNNGGDDDGGSNCEHFSRAWGCNGVFRWLFHAGIFRFAGLTGIAVCRIGNAMLVGFAAAGTSVVESK